MNTIISLLVPLLLAQINPLPKVCSLGYMGNTRVYVCTTGGTGTSSAGPYTLDTPISKVWFKAHCTKKGTKPYNTVATCDAYAVVDEKLTVKDAAGPSKVKQRIEEVAAGAALGIILAACIADGGCGAFGG